MSRLRKWAKELKRQTLVVYFAARDPRTPWLARLLALGIAAYALSPIDLIPDFIPVVGYLDDLLIVPLGLMLVLRLLPAGVLQQQPGESGSAQHANQCDPAVVHPYGGHGHLGRRAPARNRRVAVDDPGNGSRRRARQIPGAGRYL